MRGTGLHSYVVILEIWCGGGQLSSRIWSSAAVEERDILLFGRGGVSTRSNTEIIFWFSVTRQPLNIRSLESWKSGLETTESVLIAVVVSQKMQATLTMSLADWLVCGWMI